MNWLNRAEPAGEEQYRLHVEVYGKGDVTLVFVAGLGGTTRYWGPRIESLAKRHRVILVDLLGFGESPKPWTRYSLELHVQALHSALRDFGTFSLIGHSLGALLTVGFAARHPSQVDNMVLMSMPIFGSQDSAYRYFRQGPVRGGFLYTNLVIVMLTCVLTRRVFGRMLPYLVRSVPREVAEDLVKHTWRSSTSSLWEVVYRYDVVRALDELRDDIDVLCIHGEKDLMAPIAPVEGLVARRANLRLCTLPSADHHPFLRDPERCLGLIEHWIATKHRFEAKAAYSVSRSL